MSPIQHFVSPKLPTALANDTHVDLPGYDLWLIYVSSVYVVPTALDVAKFEEALSRVLQLYPHAAGQLRCTDGCWSIELTNTPIPVDIDYKFNINADSFLDGDWVIQHDLSPFLSQESFGANLVNSGDPLLRVKLTFFDHETCIGVSCSHSLGDGALMLRFMHTLSQFYQGLPAEFAAPTFEKYHFPLPSRSMVTEISSRMTLHPMPEFDEVVDADSREDLEELRWRISNRDLETLRLALCADWQDKKTLSKQDCLTAYLIAVLNRNRNWSNPVRKVHNVFHYRHIRASFVTENVASNFLLVVSANVPTDITGIAIAVRDALIQCQEPRCIYVLEALKSRDMFEAARARKLLPFVWDHSSDLFVNSSIAINWGSAHFGCPDATQFYADGVNKHYLRCFRSNPVKGEDGVWRARQSVDISMGLSADVRPKILDTLARGVQYMLNDSVVRTEARSRL